MVAPIAQKEASQGLHSKGERDSKCTAQSTTQMNIFIMLTSGIQTTYALRGSPIRRSQSEHS
jgi:hypothetical protein